MKRSVLQLRAACESLLVTLVLGSLLLGTAKAVLDACHSYHIPAQTFLVLAALLALTVGVLLYSHFYQQGVEERQARLRTRRKRYVYEQHVRRALLQRLPEDDN